MTENGAVFSATQPERRHMYITWGAVLVALVAIGASFFVVRNVGANADYICTHVVEENGDCANGSWGPWTTATTTADIAACTETTIAKRIYTGTRTTKHILQYLNLRTACDSGYAQTKSGNASGNSGFHGGTIITESTACQIEETRVTRGPLAAASCTATSTVVTTTEVTSLTTDIAAMYHDATTISGKEQLTQFRESMIAAKIYAKPALVAGGGTTVIKWQGREVTECTVEGTNGDQWEGTAGEKTSGIINNQTVYTLTCTAFNGATVTDSATVTVVPAFEEL